MMTNIFCLLIQILESLELVEFNMEFLAST
jgi:hypothetical protein